MHTMPIIKASLSSARILFRISLALLSVQGWVGCDGDPHEWGERTFEIVNGQLHDGPNDHPAVGRLNIGSAYCTATLVGQKTVLTAAHCLFPGNTHYFLTASASYKAQSVTRHPNYDPNNTIFSLTGYDIGVVMLEEAPGITPATLSTVAPTIGMSVTLIGFGRSQKGANDQGVKRIAYNTVAKLENIDLMTYLGSGGSTGNLCDGDSGGPSLTDHGGKEILIGVHSLLKSTGTCGLDGSDTRVDLYKSWLETTSGGDIQFEGTTNPTPDSGPTPDTGPAPDSGLPPDSGPKLDTGTTPSDTEAPKVSITQPATGIVKSQLTVEISATDNVQIKEVILSIDNQEIASRSAPPFSFSVNLPSGTHLITAFAIDTSGNKGSAMVSVTVEGTPNDGSSSPTGNPTPSPMDSGIPSQDSSTFNPTPQDFGETNPSNSDSDIQTETPQHHGIGPDTHALQGSCSVGNSTSKNTSANWLGILFAFLFLVSRRKRAR